MNSLISIGLSVYNGGATLKLAIDSIINQSYQNWELIILDDCSTDNSIEVIRSFDDDRIHFVEGTENIGLAARLNMSVSLARGRYFARMDQDDFCFPERFERQFEFLESNPSIDLLATNYVVFDDELNLQGKLPIPKKADHDYLCNKPWNGFYMPHPTWMGKCDWFKKNNYKSYADGAEDQNLLLRSYTKSNFYCMDNVLLAYRQNSRPWRRRVKARMIFIKSSLKSRLKIRTLSKIIFVQTLKIIGDVINVFFQVNNMGRTLVPLTKNECIKVLSLFKK